MLVSAMCGLAAREVLKWAPGQQAILIKAVGIYQPGSFVRLSTDEIAIVLKRGINTTKPLVAVLVNRTGVPNSEPILRDTGVLERRIVASLPHQEVKVHVNLEKFMPMPQFV